MHQDQKNTQLSDFRVLPHLLSCGENFKYLFNPFNHSFDHNEIKQAALELDLCNAALLKISEIVEDCFNDLSVNCMKFSYSFTNSEFLVVLYVDEGFDTIRELNAEIFNRCYQASLHDELLKLSYFVLPFDKAVHSSP